MKQNKLLILSLLASFLLLISASYTIAENTVTFGTVNDCPKPMGATVNVAVMVENDVDLAALDIIGQVVSVSGGVDLMVTNVTFDNRMDLSTVLDLRYPIGDLGMVDGRFRLGAVKLTGSDLGTGDGQIATLELTYLSDCLLGSAALDPAEYDCGEVTRGGTVFVDAAANAITPAVNAGAVNVVNALPYFTYCPDDMVIYWGASVTEMLTAEDDDIACGCDGLSFQLVSGPGGINAASGVYQWTAGGGDVGCHTVVIKVTDDYDGEALCEFDIDVLNHPPVITCPDETINILWGQTATGLVTATDFDMGPSAMTFTLIPDTYPGSPGVHPTTGVFTWVTDEEDAFVGLWEFCVIVTDNANLDDCNTENADTCCFNVWVAPKFNVMIEKVHNQLQGHYTEVSVTVENGVLEMGGFDFLIAYDASGLTFVEAEPGQLLEDCGWEYFTYRFGANGNCGNACPSGMLRIMALAETSNGPFHPDCYGPPDMDVHEIATLRFFVTNDRTFQCMYLPIYFFWMDCGDNTISSLYGDTLFLEDEVWNYGCHEGYYEVTDHEWPEFPSAYGVPDAEECLEGDKEYPLRAIDFFNGGIDIICADSIDARGDINVNGLAYEIADAVMLTNYFISGLSAFDDHVEASTAASDVNADGMALSVADLVYLVRVIQGDANPYPKTDPGAEAIAIRTQLIDRQMTVSYTVNSDVGAALLRFEFEGNIGMPVVGSGASNMDLKYSVNGNELSVLIYSLESDAISSGDNVLVTIPIEGDIKLTEVDAAGYYGTVLSYTAHVLPSQFGLAQNYPNPFNPATTIALALPIASEYTVAIYNIAGQLIRTYEGYANAGVVSLVWDGKDSSGDQVASGMYFYKAQAGKFSATKKMLLMK